MAYVATILKTYRSVKYVLCIVFNVCWEIQCSDIRSFENKLMMYGLMETGQPQFIVKLASEGLRSVSVEY